MQIDNTEFLQLQQEVGKELTCENCDCKFYVLGKRCKALYRGTLNTISSEPIDYTMYINPYLCIHFWWASKYAFEFREKQWMKLIEDEKI